MQFQFDGPRGLDFRIFDEKLIILPVAHSGGQAVLEVRNTFISVASADDNKQLVRSNSWTGLLQAST